MGIRSPYFSLRFPAQCPFPNHTQWLKHFHLTMLVVYGWDKVAGLTEGFTNYIYTMLQRVNMELAQGGAEGVDGREGCWDQGC